MPARPPAACVAGAIVSILLLIPLSAWGQTIWIWPNPPEPPDVPHPRHPIPLPTPIHGPLEVRSHQVRVTVEGQLATTRIEQVFYNPSSARIEGTFLFPMPQDAPIERFSMDVNGKDTPAELLDADKAREIYEEIVRRTRDPALLEYCDRSLLRARIFPIEPQSEKRVTLAYTQLLPSEGGLVHYRYPLLKRTVDGRSVAKLSMRIDLRADRPITTLYSPSHELEIDRHGERRATLGLETEDSSGRDFQLYFAAPADVHDALALNLLTFRDPDAHGDEEGFFLLLASPKAPADDAEPQPKDLVFALDTSGSMSDEKLEQARRALRFCLDNLNAGDRFEIIRFSTEVEPLFGRLVPNDPEHRERADGFLDRLKPIGGTAIHGALSAATDTVERREEDDRPAFIVFLTDGRPTIGDTDTETIMEAVTGEDAARVFCFGIGTDINTHLLDRIAERTRAATTYVLPEEDIELKVSRFYTRIAEPAVTDLELGVDGDVRLSKMHPQSLPDLFHGDQLVLFGRYDGDGEAKLTLRGRVNGKPVTFARTVTFPERAETHTTIPPLWAMRRVGFLLDEIRLHGEDEELRDEVVRLARAFGIVTPYTAYLIVEDEERRAIPLERQSLSALGRDRDERADFGMRYGDLAGAQSGPMAVAASESNRLLKDAAQPVAQARANEWSLGEALDAPSGATIRRGGQVVQATRYANGRAFVQNGTQWVDTRVQAHAEAPTRRVVFGSDSYFQLLREHPEAAAWLAVGRNVQVVIEGEVVEIVDEA